MRPMMLHFVILPLLLACQEAPPPADPVRAVRTLAVQAGSTATQHEYAAEVRARVESRLGFRVPGKLLQRQASLGDAVQAGQALARLDASDLQLAQQAARASQRAAQAQLVLSEAEFKRFQELRAQGFISGLELERREAALKAARSQAEQAAAQAGVQANQAGYAVLTSDAPGVVTAVEAEPGMVLAAGAAVLRLAHDGPRDAVFSVPEDQSAALRALIGRRGALQLRPWGEAQPLLPATVREVAASADPVTRTFLVKADIGNTPLRLGQTATVLLTAPAAAPAIKLPLTAVFEQGGRAQVWVVQPETMQVRLQPIEVAGADGNQVVVASGLSAGQQVVTAGVHTLTPGQRVRWYAEPGAARQAAAASATR